MENVYFLFTFFESCVVLKHPVSAFSSLLSSVRGQRRQAKHKLTHVIVRCKRQLRILSLTGWVMPSGMCSVQNCIQITHSRTPRENIATAATRSVRARTTMLLLLQRRPSVVCVCHRPWKTQCSPVGLLYITGFSPLLPASCKHQPTAQTWSHWHRRGCGSTPAAVQRRKWFLSVHSLGKRSQELPFKSWHCY